METQGTGLLLTGAAWALTHLAFGPLAPWKHEICPCHWPMRDQDRLGVAPRPPVLKMSLSECATRRMELLSSAATTSGDVRTCAWLRDVCKALCSFANTHARTHARTHAPGLCDHAEGEERTLPGQALSQGGALLSTPGGSAPGGWAGNLQGEWAEQRKWNPPSGIQEHGDDQLQMFYPLLRIKNAQKLICKTNTENCTR